MRRGAPEAPAAGGSDGSRPEGDRGTTGGGTGVGGTNGSARMLGGGRDGCGAYGSRAFAGGDDGARGRPASDSTFRTRAGMSTGRTNRPLPSCARASSGLAITPPGRATKRTWIASASGSSRMRVTASSAPSLSASMRMTLGHCTATRATSIESGTSTTA